MGEQHFRQVSARACERRAAQQAEPYARRRPQKDRADDRAGHQRRLQRADLHYIIVE